MELKICIISRLLPACCIFHLLLSGCNSPGITEDIPPLLPFPEKAVFKDGYHSADGIEDYFSTADIHVSPSFKERLGDEGYILKVDKDKIDIKAAGESGVFYARQTLSQITGKEGVRLCKIEDRPRFRYRGIHLDVSRNFFPKEQIFKILEEMARYKLNNFHFHLTDNGGWRVQIDRYPLLTELGAYRQEKDWFRWYNESRQFCTADAPGATGGFYTKEDIREIVSHAEKLHINVIPEIDMPAHSDPVFAGYPDLNCNHASSGNGEFCPANPDTYIFIRNVLDEILDMFPSQIIHIGGDEARKVEWKNCAACTSLMQKEGIEDYDQLQVYFIRKISDYLKSKGRIMAGWDEILKDSELPGDTFIYGYRGEKYAVESANRQFSTIMVPGEVFYMDWWQSDIYKEPYAMGGYSPLYKVYSFNPQPDSPEDIQANETLISSPYADIDSVGFIREENTDNIVGIQGCLWTEFIGTAEHLEYMLFPRLLAIAEKAWTTERNIDWEHFKPRLSAQRDSVFHRGINAYDLHDAPVIASEAISRSESKVTMTCEQTNGEIRYCIGSDGTLDNNSDIYTGAFTIDSDTYIKAAVYMDGKPVSYIRTCNLIAGKDKTDLYPTRWPW